jgi:hypothetical protein
MRTNTLKPSRGSAVCASVGVGVVEVPALANAAVAFEAPDREEQTLAVGGTAVQARPVATPPAPLPSPSRAMAALDIPIPAPQGVTP